MEQTVRVAQLASFSKEVEKSLFNYCKDPGAFYLYVLLI
jgi:hypothetical protein